MDMTRSDPRLALAVDLPGFFREALTSAMAERGVAATEPTEQYLVALLTDFAHPGSFARETLARPLPLLLEEAYAAAGRERFERLRTLGDAVLYTSGFFADHLQTRGVELGYVSAMGARAYGGAATMLRSPRAASPGESVPELFEELADKFKRFAEVLATLADGMYANSAQTSDTNALKTYERWLKTGSTQLAAALTERGMFPTRGQGGLH